MKKFILTTALILLTIHMPMAKKVATCGENFKYPFVLSVDQGKVYILERQLAKVFVFDKNSFKKIGEFGKRGQGPAEFMNISYISFTPGYIHVSSYPKLAIFSSVGKLIKEIRGPTEYGSFQPIGEQYVGSCYPKDNLDENNTIIQVSLFSRELKKIKDIYKGESGKSSVYNGSKFVITHFKDTLNIVVHKDKMYVGDTKKGFHFAVFDCDGRFLYEIERKYNKRRVTNDEINEFMKANRNSWGKQWNSYQMNYEDRFNEFYPAYLSFHVADDRIYVFLYPERGNIRILTLDLKGILLSETVHPQSEIGNPATGYLICINDGKLYKMRENEGEEAWELHSYDLMK